METLKTPWDGRCILDGYAIVDRYRMTTPAGELPVPGVNLSSCDAKKMAWNLKWLNRCFCIRLSPAAGCNRFF